MTTTSLEHADRILYDNPHDVFAAFKDDASVCVEEFRAGRTSRQPTGSAGGLRNCGAARAQRLRARARLRREPNEAVIRMAMC